MDQLDLVIIGTGGAAMAAGIHARAQGKNVVLIERGVVGGTCLNVGCVPSKTLLAASGQREHALHNPFPGVPTSAGRADLQSLVGQKDDLIEQMRAAKYLDVADAHGFDIRRGEARFADPQTLLVDGEPLPAAAYIVATGSEPTTPGLPGLGDTDWLTSTTAMELQELPESLIVIGGGYVGMEQAQLFAGLGTRVTLIGCLAPHAEPELAEVLREAFDRVGITVAEQRAVQVATEAGAVSVTTDDRQTVTAQRLLIATGRKARTDGLDLAAAGIEVDERGFIAVDARQQTNNPKVWAAGDVSGAPQYVYVAAETGRAAAVNALGGKREIDYTGLPAVIFTRPQLASAGLTEAEALAAGHTCDCRVLGGEDIPRALTNQDTLGALKIVIDADTGKVLGVHAALDGAGDVMLAATYAIKAGMTVDDIADTWAPYLTMSEALRIAAGLFRTDKPTSCCA
ncbi:mercury(II) reductase [Modestobacter marinus]|uniref:Mercuric reductase n=1 Tax=Modestobacter marinus TaxID=477641 RepID=A0A846M491_9ACTN|nr:mercury(II) reductase [Modestobacter marinus]NIH69320.1 mercuric reductase [Modestobacter marinus]GGL83112.1 mercuric reductase MerA [Modestobacter marinus]